MVIFEFAVLPRIYRSLPTHTVSPDTQYRQNQAMILRREMKDAGTISAGYVAYPAKLMVKFNKNDKKYVCHKDFSKIPVPIRPVPDDEQL